MRIRTIASGLARLFRFVLSTTVIWEAADGICTVTKLQDDAMRPTDAIQTAHNAMIAYT